MTEQTPPDSADPLLWNDTYLMTRLEACAYARALGIRIAVNTLAKLAGRGDGPPLVYFGPRPYYRVDDFRGWLLSRQRRARSTSEARRPPPIPSRPRDAKPPSQPKKRK